MPTLPPEWLLCDAKIYIFESFVVVDPIEGTLFLPAGLAVIIGKMAVLLQTL